MRKKNKDLESSSSTNQIKESTNVLFNIIFLVLGLTCIFPLLFVFSISITSEEALRSGGYQIIPQELSAAAYQFLWNERTMIFRAVFMSIIVTIIGTIITIALTTTMGYVVSGRNFKLKGIYTWIIFVPMIFNGGMLSSYVVVGCAREAFCCMGRLMHWRNPVLALKENRAEKCRIGMRKRSYHKEKRSAHTTVENLSRIILTGPGVVWQNMQETCLRNRRRKKERSHFRERYMHLGYGSDPRMRPKISRMYLMDPVIRKCIRLDCPDQRLFWIF